MSDDFFAPPPFDPASALATLKRQLRDLKLAERGGAFELAGQPVARAEAGDGVLKLALARRPARSPDWDASEARDHAQLRRFVDELKRRVGRWNEGRDD
jgi:hypothetical protein